MEVEIDYEAPSLKSQMRRADKLGARHVLILGEEEISRGEVQVRDMVKKTQTVAPLRSVALELQEIYGQESARLLPGKWPARGLHEA